MECPNPEGETPWGLQRQESRRAYALMKCGSWDKWQEAKKKSTAEELDAVPALVTACRETVPRLLKLKGSLPAPLDVDVQKFR